MATATSKRYCVTCEKEKVVYKCEGCSQNFCINHLNGHHQLIIKQLDDLENKRNIFRQCLAEQTTHPQKYSLLQQINLWENDSINKIKQTAEETRQSVIEYATAYINQIATQLNKLTDELKQIREENDFNEIHLNELNQKLNLLENQLNQPSDILIEQENSSVFINKISVSIPFTQLKIPNINIDAKWLQNGITVAGGNGQGSELNQLASPSGIHIDNDQTIYVAECLNCRIVEWKSGATIGRVVAGGNGRGNRSDQLSGSGQVIVDKEGDYFIIKDFNNKRIIRWPHRNGTSGEVIISNIHCSDLTMDLDGYLYASNIMKDEVIRWKIGDTNVTRVAGGHGNGNKLNQLNGPYWIFVDHDFSVYVSDRNNHRVMKWIKGAQEGAVVAGGNGQGDSLKQLSSPQGVIVDQLGTVYVVDDGNYRVMRWFKGATQGSIVVGGNGCGDQPNQLNSPKGLSFDQQNNLYIVDNRNSRVQKFLINSTYR